MSAAYQVTVTGIHDYKGRGVIRKSDLWHFSQQVWGSAGDSVPAALDAMGDAFFSYYPKAAIALPRGNSGIVIVTPSAAGRLKDYVRDPHALDSGRYFVQNDYAVIYVKELPALSGDYPDDLYPSDPNAYVDALDQNLRTGPDFESRVDFPCTLHKHPANYVEYNGAVYKLARKTVMYHGTSTGEDGEILRSILKNGLIPEPPKRAYDSLYGDDSVDVSAIDPHTRYVIMLDESFGGVYTTEKVGMAEKYAKNAVLEFGGNPLLVSSQVETRSPGVTLDEDTLFGAPLIRFLDSSIPGDAAEQFIAIDDGEIDFIALGRSFLEYYFPKHDFSKQELIYALPSFAKAIESRFMAELLGDHIDDIEKKLLEMDEAVLGGDLDPSEYIDEYRHYGAEALKKLRFLTYSDRTVRSTSAPISYRGANRILAVVSADSTSVTIHYAYDMREAKKLAMALGANSKEAKKGI